MKLCNEALILPPQGVASSLNVTGGWGGGVRKRDRWGRSLKKATVKKLKLYEKYYSTFYQSRYGPKG